MRQLVPEDIRAEMTGFSFKSASNVILKPAPLVYIDDLSKAITSALEELNRYYILRNKTVVTSAVILLSSGELTWHDCIPDNKIWVKIGGDHGGGSFKFSFHLGNALRVHSVHNVHPICCFAAGDSKTNLEVALGLYRSQVQEISSLRGILYRMLPGSFGNFSLEIKASMFSFLATTSFCFDCMEFPAPAIK